MISKSGIRLMLEKVRKRRLNGHTGEGKKIGTIIRVVPHEKKLAVEMGRHADDAMFQERACLTISNLRMDDRAAISRAGEAGAIQAVVAAMQKHAKAVSVQESACGALSVLSWNDKANQMRASEAGGIEAAVAAIGRHADQAHRKISRCSCQGE